MAETNQYSLSHLEMIELIIKHLGIHEGEWSLNLNLAIGTGHLTAAPNQSGPGVMAVILSTGIQRAMPGVPVGPGAIIVDAAKVNPAKGKKAKA